MVYQLLVVKVLVESAQTRSPEIGFGSLAIFHGPQLPWFFVDASSSHPLTCLVLWVARSRVSAAFVFQVLLHRLCGWPGEVAGPVWSRLAYYDCFCQWSGRRRSRHVCSGFVEGPHLEGWPTGDHSGTPTAQVAAAGESRQLPLRVTLNITASCVGGVQRLNVAPHIWWYDDHS